ncbi:MAG: PQQ-binding-like beta-propeller repeat protein, partial [Chlorobi bacterium]|nr:PQQ-binding-like beta-propeller repeat protein [Chlorobiota bacterium]
MFHPNNSFSQPKEKWIFNAESQLYVPPLVADVCEEPGNEIIISDSEVRTLRCISASGKQIWKLDHTWKKRLTSAAALTNKTPDGKPLLLIGNGDGSLTCIDAEKGKVIWQRNAGRIEWGSTIWVDLNDDGIDEAVAGTIDSGIVAYSIDGTKLWGYKGGNDRPVLSLKTPIAAADIDGD